MTDFILIGIIFLIVVLACAMYYVAVPLKAKMDDSHNKALQSLLDEWAALNRDLRDDRLKPKGYYPAGTESSKNFPCSIVKSAELAEKTLDSLDLVPVGTGYFIKPCVDGRDFLEDAVLPSEPWDRS